MIRFVDIRNQGTGQRFAFWDTVVNRFRDFNGQHGFESWSDVVEDIDSNIFFSPSGKEELKQRLRRLCPDWVENDEQDDLEKWYMET